MVDDNLFRQSRFSHPLGETSIRRDDPYIETFLLIVLVFAVLLLVIITSNSGFDFTDEGYYLNIYNNPFNFDASISQFGFIYHPLFNLFSKDIVTFRVFNIFVIVFISYIFAHSIMYYIRSKINLNYTLKFSISVSIAISAIVQIHWLPLTPNYNWLNLVGILIFLVAALALADDQTCRRRIFWSCVLGLGIWLCGMAKPPSGIVLGVLIIPFAVVATRGPMTVTIVAALTSLTLLLLAALAIDGSIQGFIARVQLGREDAFLLGGGYTVLQLFSRLDGINLSTSEQTQFFVVFLISGLLAWLSLHDKTWARAARLSLMACISIAILLAIMGLLSFEQSLMQGLSLAAVPLGVASIAVLSEWRRLIRVLTLKSCGILLLLVLAPLCYAVGTGNNQWFQSSHLLITWMGAAVILIAQACSRRQVERLLVTVAFGCAAVTSVLVSIGVDYPYRSAASLRHQRQPTELGANSASILKLTPESAEYLRELRSSAFRSGFKPGTPLIDLTGRHPGSVFALGGTALGQPWFVSGFPGSVDQLLAVLRRVSCQSLADAWLLVPVKESASETHAQRSPLLALKMGLATPFPSDALSPLGIDFANGFSEVMSIDSPVGYGRHKLLAPAAHEASKIRCEQARRNSLSLGKSP